MRDAIAAARRTASTRHETLERRLRASRSRLTARGRRSRGDELDDRLRRLLAAEPLRHQRRPQLHARLRARSRSKAALAPEVPHNEGSFRPVHVTAPRGSILNCRAARARSARATSSATSCPGVIFGALAPALPDRLIAGGRRRAWLNDLARPDRAARTGSRSRSSSPAAPAPARRRTACTRPASRPASRACRPR